MSDDDSKNLPTKKQKIIQPLHADDPDLLQAHDDMLRELQKRTAELAAKVQGNEQQNNRILELDSKEDEDRVEALGITEAPTKQTEKVLEATDSNPAVDLVRAKLQKLFSEEPDATTQAAESVATRPKSRSKHQQFMYELTTSGKPLATVQTEWHNYYVSLPDREKHEVWREFYETQKEASAFSGAKPQHASSKTETKEGYSSKKRGKNPFKNTTHDHATTVDKSTIKKRVQNKVSANGRLTLQDHIKSLAVGLGLTLVVGGLIIFVFFNQVFIAPFLSPSRNVSATPILDQNAQDIGDEPKIIIPKINVEVPVVYDINSIEEQDIQDALENGVVHYATTPKPGERGNGVIVGHSSNNILNSGKYKFAFVLLRKLEVDDTFYINYEGVRYTYKIYEKKVVSPTDVSVLGPAARDNSFTLITCDPPGTSTNRLIIVGEQVSPDPGENNNPSIDLDSIEGGNEEIVPGNAPSLWSRLWPF